FRTTFQLNYQPIKGADIEFSYTPEFNGSSGKTFNKSISTYDPGMETPTYTNPTLSSLRVDDTKTWRNTIKLIGKYNKAIQKHNLAFLGGYEQIAFRTDVLSARRQGFPL